MIYAAYCENSVEAPNIFARSPLYRVESGECGTVRVLNDELRLTRMLIKNVLLSAFFRPILGTNFYVF